jgi:general secretion pathway protein F
MNERSIQDVIELNKEIVALVAAGLPMDFGETGDSNRTFAGSTDELPARLDQVTTALMARVGRGQSLQQAVLDEPGLPTNYRKALLTFLICDDSRLALEVMSEPAGTKRQFAGGVGGALVYPLIILAIAYAGFLYLCTFTGPTIESMYRQMGQAPSLAVSFLVKARELIPIWGPLVPLLIAASLWWWARRGRTLSWRWLPGSKRYYDAVRHAQLAEYLAGMMNGGCTLNEALAAAFPDTAASGTSATDPGGPVANQVDRSSSSAPRGIKDLPPLLRWAIEGDRGEESPAKVMGFVAMTYRETARQRERVWRFLAPLLCGLAFGGVIVLAYGLSLFLPVARLLRDVAAAGINLGGI